eukprot:2172571-Rhodomonas_salina.1
MTGKKPTFVNKRRGQEEEADGKKKGKKRRKNREKKQADLSAHEAVCDGGDVIGEEEGREDGERLPDACEPWAHGCMSDDLDACQTIWMHVRRFGCMSDDLATAATRCITMHRDIHDAFRCVVPSAHRCMSCQRRCRRTCQRLVRHDPCQMPAYRLHTDACVPVRRFGESNAVNHDACAMPGAICTQTQQRQTAI